MSVNSCVCEEKKGGGRGGEGSKSSQKSKIRGLGLRKLFLITSLDSLSSRLRLTLSADVMVAIALAVARLRDSIPQASNSS